MNIRKLLVCPFCKKALKNNGSFLICKACHKKYNNNNNSNSNNKFNFSINHISRINQLDNLKFLFKKYQKIYSLLIKIISPVYVNNNLNNHIKKYFHPSQTILNIGSGNSKIYPNIINLDIFPYNNVDIVGDASNTPFKNESFDHVINIALIEHVSEPEKIVNEIFRLLKPGGIVYAAIPFIQGFHASPFDFQRYTYSGIEKLFNKFKKINILTIGGPTSGMLWIFQEWLAILLSFGSKRIYNIFLILIMVLTFPLKFLDIFLSKYCMAKNITSGFVFVGKK